MSSAFDIRRLDAGQRALLQEAFPRARDEIAWLAANPAGTRFWVAREGTGGSPLAWVAGVGRRVWLGEREARFTSLGDVRGDGSVGDAAAALETAAGWAEAWAETLYQDEDLVQLAWPSDGGRARFAGWDVVRTQHVLARAVGEGPRDAPAEVETPERFDHEARWLWDRCAGSFRASAVRDADALNWRFLDHPLHPYRVLAVRGAEGPIAGLAVYRLTDWLAPRSAVLVEWLVPADEEGVGGLLLDGLLAAARREGARSLATALVEWSPWFERLQRAGYRAYPSPLFLVERSARRSIHELWLREGYWYTLGDTELV